MEIDDALKIERYKFVTDRQKYFTELARDAFGSYAKLYAAGVAGAVAVISARHQLELRSDTVVYLIRLIAYLLTILGIVASLQIAFCLARWRGFRRAEQKVYAASPKIDWWWWIFEALYVVAILIGIACAWAGVEMLPDVLPRAVPTIGSAPSG